MNPIDVAQQYFDAWNRRDPAAVLATMAEDGTYSDPGTGGPISGQAFAGYMQGLFAAFPDVSFSIASVGLAAPDLVAAQWIMRGTNSGSMMGLPPTGKPIELHGADFIRVSGRPHHERRGLLRLARHSRAGGVAGDRAAEGDWPLHVRERRPHLGWRDGQAGCVQRHGAAFAWRGRHTSGQRAEPPDRHRAARHEGVSRTRQRDGGRPACSPSAPGSIRTIPSR